MREKASRRTAFTTAKLELQRWITADPDPGINSDAKLVAIHILHCTNIERMQCNPSQQTIADELSLRLRTVERAIRNLSGKWIEKRRPSRTTSNHYVFVVNADRVAAIEDRLEALAEQRRDERERRKSEPTVQAGRRVSEPTVQVGSNRLERRVNT